MGFWDSLKAAKTTTVIERLEAMAEMAQSQFAPPSDLTEWIESARFRKIIALRLNKAVEVGVMSENEALAAAVREVLAPQLLNAEAL
jgi:hypothetical protein